MNAWVLAHGPKDRRRYLVEISGSGRLVQSPNECDGFHFPTQDAALMVGSLLVEVRNSSDWRALPVTDKCNRLTGATRRKIPWR